MTYAPAPTFAYASPNPHNFYSAMNPGADAEIGLIGDAMGEEVFQLHTKVLEERETIEEEEFDEADGMEFLLNFPLDEAEPTLKKGKQEGEESNPESTLKRESQGHESPEDAAMLDACLTEEVKHSSPADSKTPSRDLAALVEAKPLEIKDIAEKAAERDFGNESMCVAPALDLFNIDTPTLGGNDYHLNKLSQLKK